MQILWSMCWLSISDAFLRYTTGAQKDRRRESISELLGYDFHLSQDIKPLHRFNLDLPDSSIPPILGTVASPLQYGYRTKITPHFDAPPKRFQKRGPAPQDSIEDVTKPVWLKIGFNHVGQRQVMDIEVGTFLVNQSIQIVIWNLMRIVQSPRL